MRYVVLFVSLAVACFTAQIYAADPVEGYWKSIDEQGKVTAYWKFWIDNEELKGTIVKVPDKPDDEKCTDCKGDSEYLKNKPVLGTIWLWGFKKDDAEWVKGKIVDLKSGSIYWASVTPIENNTAIKLRGSLDRWGIAGRTQIWKKVSDIELKTIGVLK
jgi:uncharacterized protein (DUF2147 family)